jgi:triphosphoribosyl-dephospho-CoA synthase
MNKAGEEAFLLACGLDVAVQKPGNVSIQSPGHGMQAAMFVASAKAAAPHLFSGMARVGERIEAATAASWAAVGCNTNLGIVLLCAPIAAAWQVAPTSWWSQLDAVLTNLNIADSEATYRAIRQANPGGLGDAPSQDVRQTPSLGLRSAMALAAARDSIARQYANGFADVAAVAAAVGAAADASPTATAAWVQLIYLHWLATLPDSHIVRKHGPDVAQTVMSAAQAWLRRAQAGAALDTDPAFLAWDHALKSRAINPGTSADLTVATLLWHSLGRVIPSGP